MASKETNRAFNQLINAFLEDTKRKNEISEETEENIQLIPILIYNDLDKKLKIKFKIGKQQYYDISNLPDFFDRMINKEKYKYGPGLEIVHKKEMFDETVIPLYDFIMKNAEIIKFANEVNNNYAYYGRNFNVSSIRLSNSGLDEIFEILKGQTVLMQTEYGEKKIKFINEPIDIEYILEKQEDRYILKTNIDVFEYEILYGSKYSYFLIDNKLYRCPPKLENINIKLLEIYKKNYLNEIVFNEKDLNNFFSVIVPKIKNNFKVKNIDKEEVERYMPQDLFVQLYLDYDINDNITADILFCYKNTKFNPIKNVAIEIPRNMEQENETLDIFVSTGFKLDVVNARLVLDDEEKIYDFLSNEIEQYMKKFEVLVTDSFKTREIKKIKLETIGVKIENNLLDIDFSNLNFDIKELKDIIERYKLKKKFYKLKDRNIYIIRAKSNIRSIRRNSR